VLIRHTLVFVYIKDGVECWSCRHSAHTHLHTLTASLPHTHSLTPSLPHSHIASLPHCLTHTHPHSLNPHSHTLTASPLTHTHPHCLTPHSHTPSLPHPSLTHTFTASPLTTPPLSITRVNSTHLCIIIWGAELTRVSNKHWCVLTIQFMVYKLPTVRSSTYRPTLVLLHHMDNRFQGSVSKNYTSSF
jgi:hypothetical protein